MLNKTPQDYRQYILDMLTVAGGSWQATGCTDEALENKIIYLLGELHPKREVALLIWQAYINTGVAA